MKIGLIGWFILLGTLCKAQSVQSDFSLPAQACIGQHVQPANNSVNAIRYEWDVCQGDLGLMPSTSSATNLNGNVTTGVELVFDGTNWFGFIANQGGNSILRLDFGTDITSVPVITNLGNISGVINFPTDIKVFIDNGNWYGFVYGLSNPMISRIDFGNSLANTPSAVAILSGSGSTNGGLDMIREGSGWMIVASFFNTLKSIRLTNVTSVPTASDVLDVTAFGSSLGDLVLLKESGVYYAYATDFGTNSLYKATFGSSVFFNPVVNNMNVSVLSGVSPFGLDAGYDNGNHYLFVSTIQGSLIRVNLGQNLLATSAAGSALGNFGQLENTLKIKIVKHQTRWFAFTPSWSSTKLYRVDFTEPACEINPAVLIQNEPTITYTSSGDKAITLRAFAASGEYAETTKKLPVISSQAPQISIDYSNYCVASPTQFSATATLPLTAYAWDFGDFNNSTQPIPSHQYGAVGTYQVSLLATANNGCQNTAVRNITIYSVPVANFTLPSPALSCTHQQYAFGNTTTADPGSNPAWQWQIDGITSSTSEHPNLSFSTTGNHNIKLIASIPGCESEITKTFNVQAVGPHVSFTITGQCEDSAVEFDNTTSGPVTNYVWDFGDGESSSESNPYHSYTAPGNYTVTLNALNASGCTNSFSIIAPIYSQPQTDFTALAPPFSCSGTPTEFSDLTPPPPDSNLSSWSWNFGDTGSSSNTSGDRNSHHTYSSAGDYTVTLTVSTNFSCTKTLQKLVTIYQSPVAAFNHSALCEDNGVTFSDAGSSNQAWSWQIGSSFYSTKNPVHTFSNPGNYNVSLSVTGINNCVGSTSQTVTIPNKLNVDFTTLRSCVNQETEFTDITDDTADPITQVNWSFGGLGTSAASPAIVTFLETGTVNVTLTVNTQSGCEFPVTKQTVIAPGPLAAFTAFPNMGETPLAVQFTNTSLNASSFSWKFNSTGSVSTETSPFFLYVNEGNYTVELIATDLNHCVDTTQQLIEVVPSSELHPPSPNPSSGAFTIEWQTHEATQTQIVLVDGLGRIIRNFDVMAHSGINRYVLDITGEQPGLYILTIRYLNVSKTYRLMISE